MIVCLLAGSARAADLPAGTLATQGARHVAQIVSDLTVSGVIGADSWASWKAPNRTWAFLCQAIREAGGFGLAQLAQHWIHSPRPPLPQNSGNGFPSAHATVAFTGLGNSSIPWWADVALGVGTAVERVQGGDHTWKQVIGGGILGTGLAFIRCGGS